MSYIFPLTRRNKLIYPSGDSFDFTTIENNILWLDGADASTLTLNGNDITGWADKSGLGNNFLTTIANDPSYTGTMKGKTVPYLDGANSEAFNIPEASMAGWDDWSLGATIITVVSFDADAGDCAILDQGFGTNRLCRFGYCTSSSAIQFISYSTGASGSAITNSINNSAANFIGRDVILVGLTGATANQIFSIDGNAYVDSDPAGGFYDAWGGTLTLGLQNANSAYHDGNIAEVAVFNRRLTNTELNEIGQAMQAKWGVNWTDF